MSEKDDEKAYKYARDYLSSIDEKPDYALRQENCSYCHSQMANDEIEQEINANGHFIYKMEGCP